MADGELLRQVNRDIWHAFRRAYGACDASGFLAVHSPDLIRAGGPDKRVYGFDEYAAQTTQWFAGLAGRGERVGIDFRFVERVAAGDPSSERGIYRITATRADGDRRVFYGRFHTFARNVDGRWRIAVDYDSDEGGTVDEAAFAAGAEIDDVGAFGG
jgi:ketosteroid isomerase-like protein